MWTGGVGMQQRLRQCAELERSFFPSCFSVLLRPVSVGFSRRRQGKRKEKPFGVHVLMTDTVAERERERE